MFLIVFISTTAHVLWSSLQHGDMGKQNHFSHISQDVAVTFWLISTLRYQYSIDFFLVGESLTLGCEPEALLTGPGVPLGLTHCQDFPHTQKEMTGRY